MGYTKRNCDNDNCNKEYFADNRNLKRGWGLTCSKSCASSKREKSKSTYDAERVKRNNVRRKYWNYSNVTPPTVIGGSGIVTGFTSEGYRIMGGIAYNEFDEKMYNVNF